MKKVNLHYLLKEFTKLKKIFSDLSKVCQKYRNNREVNICAVNFFMDPGYIGIVPDVENLDIDIGSYKLCDNIKFTSKQLKLIQRTDYMPWNMLYFKRLKRSHGGENFQDIAT